MGIFIKTLSTCCFSTCTLILLKKVVAKLQKNYQTKHKSYYSSLHSIPPSSPNNFNATIYLLFPKSQLFICVFNITSMKKEKNSEIYINKKHEKKKKKKKKKS